MIRRSFRIGLLLGLLGGAAVALAKLLAPRGDGLSPSTRPAEPWPRLSSDPAVPARPTERAVTDPAAPSPAPAERAPAAPKPAATKAPKPAATTPGKQPAKPAAKKKPAAKAWVEPKGKVCPTSHPVKAKLASKIFHLPGMLNYERTSPDRCYADQARAEADGLRAAKR